MEIAAQKYTSHQTGHRDGQYMPSITYTHGWQSRRTPWLVYGDLCFKHRWPCYHTASARHAPCRHTACPTPAMPMPGAQLSLEACQSHVHTRQQARGGRCSAASSLCSSPCAWYTLMKRASAASRQVHRAKPKVRKGSCSQGCAQGSKGWPEPGTHVRHTCWHRCSRQALPRAATLAAACQDLETC